MDAVEFLKAWKRFRKEERKSNCILCKNRDRSAEKRGKCACNSEENLIDCMIRYIDGIEKMTKETKEIELTEQQKTAIRGRIAEGTLWVCKDKFDDDICFSVSEPYKEYYDSTEYSLDDEYSIATDKTLYKFVTFENSPIYLPDLLKENN